MSTAPPRLQDVLPPSRSGETGLVVRVAVAIAVVTVLWISSGRARFGAGEGWVGLQEHQMLFADLDAATQRAMRELHEGTLEAVRLRGEDGKWPDAARLAAELVPPFAADGVDRGRRRWSCRVRKLVIEYVGVATAGDGTRGLLVQLVEPEPGQSEQIDPRVPLEADESHRLLPDGTVLHVSFWVERADAPRGTRETGDFVDDPARAGWTQVLRRSP